MASSTSKKADRIFVQNGRRYYRRAFSATETRIGIIIVLVLAAILVWVAWRGAHPDPALFMLETDLAQAGAAGTAGMTDRGPVPAGLAADGWSEEEVSQFDYDNLYEKINGREGYYKSFGFERLYAVTLVSEKDAQTAVDIELYDLGNAANSLGAYSGERSPDAAPHVSESGMSHMERNALFLTRGRYYLRAIGSDESPEVIAQLERVRSRFESEMSGEPLPWGYALFMGRMGMELGSISYARENALSFGFARNVYTARLEGGGELFVTPAGSESAATELAGRFLDGFRNYGTDAGDFVKDRYRGTLATARAVGPWVVGIRNAPEPQAAHKAVQELATIVSALPLPAETSEPPAAESGEETYETDEY